MNSTPYPAGENMYNMLYYYAYSYPNGGDASGMLRY
jgi:hypothetical protein